MMHRHRFLSSVSPPADDSVLGRWRAKCALGLDYIVQVPINARPSGGSPHELRSERFNDVYCPPSIRDVCHLFPAIDTWIRLTLSVAIFKNAMYRLQSQGVFSRVLDYIKTAWLRNI